MTKFQVPTVGGIRKVIKSQQVGTTIAEFGQGTITLAQLKAALGVAAQSSTPGSQTGNIAPGAGGVTSIIVGPGLTGGGPLVGAVQVGLGAPIPVFMFSDGGDGEDGAPGPAGVNGTIGFNGKDGAAIYLSAEDGEDAAPPVPGGLGPQGVTGASGAQQFGAYWTANTGAIIIPVNSVERLMNASGTIKEVIVVTKGGTGSCTINIYKAAITSHYPPTSADDITGGANVVISGGVIHQDSTLTGWTTTFNQDDVFLFTLQSSTVFQTVGIFLRV